MGSIHEIYYTEALMSNPTREAEIMFMTEDFWNSKSLQEREKIAKLLGFRYFSDEIAKQPFKILPVGVQREIVGYWINL